ncbi:MAG: polyprenyl synthetase family protein [Ilumatobacteraceae bacterium]
MVNAPAFLGQIASRVDSRLQTLLEGETKRWSQLDPDLAAPFDELSRLVLLGGKHLRSAFCFLGFIGAGGDPSENRIIDAGAAIELLHACALFHDDVIDGSATRRGVPTTHTARARQHEASNWAGESRRFGEGVAILVGDLAFVYADQLLADAPPPVWKIWNELRLELNIGQYLDLLGTAQSDRRRTKAERISRYKSGKYTIERPLHLGALLANPAIAEEFLVALSAYGLPLGDAFQMRDDVLGAFGDSSTTGKPVGDDLREGKPTPLLAIAIDRANTSQRKVLQLVGKTQLSDAQVADVQQAIRKTGALEEIEAHINSLTETAVDAARLAPITQEARDGLIQLATFVSWREV